MIPVWQILRTIVSVSSTDGNTLILQLIPIPNGLPISVTRAFSILTSLSTSDNNAEPMPPEVEKCFGQPQFKSMAETSFATRRAASTAVSGDPLPIWNTRRDFSVG